MIFAASDLLTLPDYAVIVVYLHENLKPAACFALMVQILIYCLL